jgi:hypothetical protein
LLRSRLVEGALYQVGQSVLHEVLGKVHRRLQQFDDLAELLLGVPAFVAHGQSPAVGFAQADQLRERRVWAAHPT